MILFLIATRAYCSCIPIVVALSAFLFAFFLEFRQIIVLHCLFTFEMTNDTNGVWERSQSTQHCVIFKKMVHVFIYFCETF